MKWGGVGQRVEVLALMERDWRFLWLRRRRVRVFEGILEAIQQDTSDLGGVRASCRVEAYRPAPRRANIVRSEP